MCLSFKHALIFYNIKFQMCAAIYFKLSKTKLCLKQQRKNKTCLKKVILLGTYTYFSYYSIGSLCTEIFTKLCVQKGENEERIESFILYTILFVLNIDNF